MKTKKDPRIETDRDYIDSKKHNNSLQLLLEEHPTGVSDKIICKVLQISADELDEIYKTALAKFKAHLN
jgi:hypothetical protein